MAKSNNTSVGRRGFLRNAAAGAAAGAAALVTPPLVDAQAQSNGTGAPSPGAARAYRLPRRRSSIAKRETSGPRWPCARSRGRDRI